MKKKKYGKTILILLAVIAVLVAFLYPKSYIRQWVYYMKYAEDTNSDKDTGDSSNTEGDNSNYVSLEEKDFLTVSGREIVNQSGETVVLSGINLGGWLLQEYWMCPVQGNPTVEQWTHLETLETLEGRFGAEEARELISIYEDNWIIEEDFKNIADIGHNVVRIPFTYLTFMSDANGTWLNENPDENPGFQRLDWAIEMAGKYGLYVILDMHGAPGGQTTDHVDGTPGKAELFTNEEYQSAMENLWVAISTRYKDSPVVAAYDIMNEPELQEGDEYGTMDDSRNQIYDRMIKAIRNNGDNHMITVEGIWSLWSLLYPENSDWDNVVYQVHSYWDEASSYCETVYNYSVDHQVPVYIGEFSDQSYFAEAAALGISCTSWTYKGTGSGEGVWFVYESTSMQSVDVLNDPYWLIEKKWGSCIQTKYFTRIL